MNNPETPLSPSSHMTTYNTDEIELASTTTTINDTQIVDDPYNTALQKARPRVQSFRKSVRSFFTSLKGVKIEDSKQSIITDLPKDSEAPIYIDPVPYPSHFDDYETPTTVPELFDELLIYTFSFLDYRELLVVGQVSRQWQQLSQMDVLWKREYQRITFELANKDEHLQQDFRSHFLQLHHRSNLKKQERQYVYKRLKCVNNGQSAAICGYAFIAPMVFVCALMFLSVIVPLILDDRIPFSGAGIQFVSVPTVFILLSFGAILLGLVYDTKLINRLKRRYIDYLSNENLLTAPVEEMGAYTFNEELDDGWISTFELLLSGVFYLPLLIACLLIHWTASLTHLYIVSLTPVFVYGAFVCMGQVVSFFKLRNNTVRDNRLLPGFMGFSVVTVGIFIEIETVLIALKLDGIITSAWNVALIPMWLCMIVLCGVCPLYTAFAVFLDDDELSGQVICIGVLLQAMLYPLQAFIIMFALRLDNVYDMQYVLVFVPLYVFESLFICCFCLASGCCVTCKVFNNLQWL